MKQRNFFRCDVLSYIAVTVLLLAGSMRLSAQETYRLEEAPVAVQLHTNTLFDAVLCPNIGVELQTDLGIAVQADYIGAWWNRSASNKYYSTYAFQTEVRYYLDSRRQTFPYTGHHIGLYGQMATYDMEFGGRGYQSADLDNTFGVGVAYGYTFPLSRHWSLNLTAGIGYFSSRYLKYMPVDDGYLALSHNRLSWFGPTRLEASFVYNINICNQK